MRAATRCLLTASLLALASAATAGDIDRLPGNAADYIGEPAQRPGGQATLGERPPRPDRRRRPGLRRGDGSAVLAVTLRALHLGLNPRGFGGPSHDSLVLTADQRALFGKAGAKAGRTWKVRATVVQRLHKVLSPNSDPNTLPRADEVTFAVLTARVERVGKGVAYLRYTGRITGTHAWEFPPNKGKEIDGDVKFTGVGTCDAKTGELRSITLVGAGEYRHFPPYDKLVKYGAVVEWRAR